MEEELEAMTVMPDVDPFSVDEEHGIAPRKIEEVNIGLTDEVLDEAVKYMEGKQTSPKFLEVFKSDGNSRVKDFALVATTSQLARVPALIKLLNKVCQHLYSTEVLNDMDMKDLSALAKNTSAEIGSIIESARKTLDTIDRGSGLSGEYKDVLDSLLSKSPEELAGMKEFLGSLGDSEVKESKTKKSKKTEVLETSEEIKTETPESIDLVKEEESDF